MTIIEYCDYFPNFPISNALPALPAVLIALLQLLPYDYCPEVVTISDNLCINILFEVPHQLIILYAGWKIDKQAWVWWSLELQGV